MKVAELRNAKDSRLVTKNPDNGSNVVWFLVVNHCREPFFVSNLCITEIFPTKQALIIENMIIEKKNTKDKRKMNINYEKTRN